MKTTPLFTIIFLGSFCLSVSARETKPFIIEAEPVTQVSAEPKPIVAQPAETQVNLPTTNVNVNSASQTKVQSHESVMPQGQWQNSLSGIQQVASILLEKNDQLQAQFDMLDKQLLQLEKAIALQNRENNRMRRDLAMRVRAVNDGTWIDQLKTKIDLKQNELERKKKGTRDLRVKIESEKRALDLHRLQLEDLKLQQQSLQMEVQTREKMMSANDVDQHPQIVQLTKQLASVHEQINMYQKQLDDLAHDNVPTKEELASLVETNQSLVKEIQDETNALEEKRRLRILDIERKHKELFQHEIEKKERLLGEMAALREKMSQVLLQQADIKKQHEDEMQQALQERQARVEEHEMKRLMLLQQQQEQEEMIKQAEMAQKKDEQPQHTMLVREMSRIDAHNQFYTERIADMRENVAILEENLNVLRRQHQKFEKKRTKAN